MTRKAPELKVWVLLLVLTAAAYLSSLRVPFHFDDEHSIVMNQAIHHLSWSELARLWTDAATSSALPDNRSYRPLKFTFDAFCWAIGGGATWPFHLLKIFMHSVVCACVYAIWKRLFQIPGWYPIREAVIRGEHVALGLSIVFALHPAMTEVVTYISATSSLQCTFFYLIAFLSYLKGRDGRSKLWLALSLFAYVASCMSKEEGVTLPVVILMTEFFISEGTFRQRLRSALRSSAAHGVLFIFIALVFVKLTPASNAKSRGNIPSYDYLLTQTRAWLWYMKLWFWPWGLNADNVEFGFSHSILDSAVVQALLGNILLLGTAIFYRRKFPALLFGLLWFYVTIAPASSVLPLAEPVNEHRMYLSYVGFSGGALLVLLWLFVEALTPQWTQRAILSFFGGVSILAFIGTFNRIAVWKSSESLWKDTVEKNPTSGRARNNLALIYMSRGQFAQAKAELSLCESFWPAYLYCPLNKGIIGIAEGKESDAEKGLMRARALDPESPWVCFQLGRYYHQFKKDLPQAVFYLSKADQLTSGNYLEAKEWLAQTELELGNKEKARALASDVLRAEPSRKAAQDILSRLR